MVEITSELNKESQLNVNTKTDKFSKGENEIMDGIEWKKGLTKNITKNNSVIFVDVVEVLEPSPKSLDEAQEVDSIIKTFKYHFSPALQAGKTDSTQSMFLTSPSIFNVQFKIGQNENQYVPKYGDCVLTDIDVNYAPNGFASHEDGAPVQTTLNLTFKEIVIVDRDKIAKGTLR